MENITPRGWFVLGILAGLAVWLGWEIATHLYWTGSGYCWGTFEECIK